MLGIPKDTLRYYDRIGIVSPYRGDNRYRKYSKSDLIDLMNIQVMQYAGFSLDEIRGKFGIHTLENISPDYCEEVAAFFETKIAETRKRIAHLEKVSQLLDAAAETLRDLNPESDRRLAEIVQETYREIRKTEPGYEGDCNEPEG